MSSESSMISIRRAELTDIPLLNQLVLDQKEHIASYFGGIDLANIIDASPFSVVATTTTGSSVRIDPVNQSIVGFAALSNGPYALVDDDHGNIDGRSSTKISQGPWTAWFKSRFDIKEVEIWNAKFLSVFASTSVHAYKFLDMFLSSAFQHIPLLSYVLFLIPENSQLYAPLYYPILNHKFNDLIAAEYSTYGELNPVRHNYFTPIPSKLAKNYKSFACSKAAFLPQFLVRRAMVEDWDDVLPILTAQHVMNDIHEEYPLSDILDPQAKGDWSLVAEEAGIPVGFINCTRNVNVDFLHQHFDIHEHLGQHLSIRNNVFCISIFALKNSASHYSIDILKHTFSTSGDCEYVILLVPSEANRFQLLNYFERIPTRPDSEADFCLYVTSRAGLLSNLEVRQVIDENSQQDVKQFISKMNVFKPELSRDSSSKSILPTSLSSSDLAQLNDTITMVVERDSELVAVAKFKALQNARALVDQFFANAFCDVSVQKSSFEVRPVVLTQFLVDEVYAVRSRWMLEEFMRASGISILFKFTDVETIQDTYISRILKQEMVPVPRRRQILFPRNLRDDKPVPPQIRDNLQVITMPLIYEPQGTINRRVIVLGCSDVALALMSKLVYNGYLNFTQVYLISSNGIQIQGPNDGLISNRCYNYLLLEESGISQYVTTIRETATFIDRISRRVRLANGTSIGYDYLCITYDLQFTLSGLPVPTGQKIMSIYAVNPGELDDLWHAIDEFRRTGNPDGKVLVYGKDLQVFATVEGLLRRGIQGKSIVLVTPGDCNCFPDKRIYERIKTSLDIQGILFCEGDTIESIDEDVVGLELNGEIQQLNNIHLILVADNKNMDFQKFQCLHKSSLVVDGLLTIDEHFRTNDPCIFSAGNITRLRSSYKTRWSHAPFDLHEVGSKLGDLILHLVDPHHFQDVTLSTRIDFKQAKRLEAYMPGGLHYLHFSKPLLQGDMPNSGRDLIVDKPEFGFFKIHINECGFIETLTYLGHREVPVDNYLCLYGLHEKYLNNMVSRFDEGIIPDFVTFLGEAWALPIYHDKFPEYVERAQGLMARSSNEQVKEILSMIKANFSSPSNVNKAELYESLVKSGGASVWDSSIYDFLLSCEIYESFP